MFQFALLYVVVLFLLGVVTGGLSNMTSGGAGIFTIFFLTQYVGLSIQDSTGTVLAASTLIVLVGALSFLRKGDVNRQLALTVGLSGVAAAFFAARWATSVNSVVLKEVYGVFTLALAIYTASRLVSELRVTGFINPFKTTNLRSGGPVTAASPIQSTRWTGTDPVSLSIQIAKGVFIGLATGLFGVGLASLSIILFLILFRLDMKTILGTSLVASFMRYLGGSFGYLSAGQVDPYYFTIIAVGGALGSLVGAKMILRSGQGRMDSYVKLVVIGIMLFVSYNFLLSRLVA